MLHGQSQRRRHPWRRLRSLGSTWQKRVFQIHAAAKDGRPVLRKKVSRAQLLGFLAKQPPPVVAMEACATAHDWGRAISGLGHDVRLDFHRLRTSSRLCAGRRTTPPTLRRSPRRPLKADDALCGVEDGRAASAIHDLPHARPFGAAANPVGQRTTRPILAEHGIVAAHGLAQVKALATAMRDRAAALHPLVRELGQRYLDHIARLDVEIAEARQEVAAILQGR